MTKVPQLKKKPRHELDETSLAAALNWDELALTDAAIAEDAGVEDDQVDALIKLIEGQ